MDFQAALPRRRCRAIVLKGTMQGDALAQVKNVVSAQIRAARGLCGYTQGELASAAGLSSMTVKRAEGSGSPYPTHKAVKAILAALEAAGVEFIPENGGGGAGVRFIKRH